MSITTELVTLLKTSSITNMNVYAESFPAVKKTTENTVCFITVASNRDRGNREKTIYSIRIMVSGTASGSMAKAKEVFNYILGEDEGIRPVWLADSSTETTSYIINKVLADSEPVFARNRGNVFFVTFQLTIFASTK